MFNTASSQPYHGVIVDFTKLDDVLLKIYFSNILGRDPKKYEWNSSGISKEGVISGLKKYFNNSNDASVPHVAVSFPHVTTLYRFGDSDLNERNTNFHKVGYGMTREEQNMLISFSNNSILACPLELVILFHEMDFRSNSYSLSDYMGQSLNVGTEIAIKNSGKLI